MDISNQLKKHPRLVLSVVIVAAGLLLDMFLEQRTPAPGTLVSTGKINEKRDTPADPASTLASTPASTLSGDISFFSENTSSALPEPQYTPNGLLLKTFEQAHDLCTEKKQRLPTTLEVAHWATRNGALLDSVSNAKQLGRDKTANAIYLERNAKASTVDFYFDNNGFVYPKNRPITNASIWTSDARALGGLHNAKYYAFSLYEAKFSAVPETSSLAVVCMTNSPKGTL